MKTVGLIVEYNPFHNGHKYHLNKSKEKTNATHSVAVMSGNFLQRGEPALFDKFTRSEIAVKNGVDLIIELPTLFATQSAELFSYGALCLLNNLNIVDDICFGSEEGNIEVLKSISEILVNEPQEFKENLKKYLDEGNLFATARSNALFDYIIKNDFYNDNIDYTKNNFLYNNLNSNNVSNNSNLNKDELLSILNSSNNILGIEYIKSILKLNSKINPNTITRIMNSYNSEEIESEICSATAIRKNLKDSINLNNYSKIQSKSDINFENNKEHKLNIKNDLEFLKDVVPNFTYETIKQKINDNFNPMFDENYFEILSSIIYRDYKDLEKIFEVNEGIENKIYSNIFKYDNLEEYMLSIKSKRYTLTKIKRILNNILLRITKEDIEKIKSVNSMPYVRVLAFNDNGRELIKKIKENSEIKIITKFSDTQFLDDEISKTLLKYDVLATNIYNNLYYKNNRDKLKGAMDFYISPKYIKLGC